MNHNNLHWILDFGLRILDLNYRGERDDFGLCHESSNEI